MATSKLSFANGMIRNELQSTMPKFRRRKAVQTDHCFAWPFKSCQHWLVIAPGEAWGTMSTKSFLGGWIPSNGEARRTIEAHLKRYPKALEAVEHT